MGIYRKIKINLLFTIIISFLLILIPLTSCSTRSIKENLTADSVSHAYKDTSYKCWIHNINEEKKDVYKYISELKVYNPDNENDYIFVYFFVDEEKAESYEKEYSNGGFFLWLFSLIYGDASIVNYDRYDYIVVESRKSKSTPSRENMIHILEDYIYQ